MKVFSLIILLFSCSLAVAQFPPAAGTPGSTAIHLDSADWVCWADYCHVQRGYMDLSNPSLGLATSGSAADALGMAGDGGVISLGDKGVATLSFPFLITNGPGPDFAVFENAFNNTFLELAFVEVSSDGQHFVRFPAVSNTDTNVQVGSFGSVDATMIHNLAGKYRSGYGTPFDLEELKDSIGIDINRITHVRIIDVVGSIVLEYCSRDSRGVIINDPWSTPFNEGGFDLDAVGVLNAVGVSSVNNQNLDRISIFPNPAVEHLTIKTEKPGPYQIFNIQGELILSGMIENIKTVYCGDWPSGVYVISMGKNNFRFHKK